MNVQFFVVCLLFAAALAFGIDNLFFQHKVIEKLELKTPKKTEKLVRKAKFSGFIFLVAAVAMPVIVFF